MASSIQEAMEEAIEKEEPVEQEEPREEEDIADRLERELANMRGDEAEPTAEAAVAEEGSEANSDPEGAEENSGDVSENDEDDEETWLASQSERSQERYRQLAERARLAEEEAAAIRKSGEELYSIMMDSGVTTQDLTDYFEYYKSIKNGNLNGAAQYWNNLERTHSQYTGQRVGNADPLDNHPDLKNKVAELEVTEDAARELASLRDYSLRMQQREQELAQMNQQSYEAQQEQQQAAYYAQSAATELDKWSAEMQAKDPQFSQKEALLLERAQEQFPNMHPAYWPEFVAREYAYLSKAMPGEAPPPKSPNTIRPSSGKSTMSKEPSTVADALDQALREMRG